MADWTPNPVIAQAGGTHLRDIVDELNNEHVQAMLQARYPKIYERLVQLQHDQAEERLARALTTGHVPRVGW